MKPDYKKAMKWWGILCIIIALVNVGSVLFSYFQGDLKMLTDLPAEYKTMVMVFFFVCLGLVVLVELYLGIQALRQSAGKYNGTSHITIAKIVSVVIVIAAIINIVGFIQKTVTFRDCWILVADVLVI